jgi:cell division inhibitor SepF
MEELDLQDKAGFFSRIGKMFGREETETPVDDAVEQTKTVTLRSHRYLVSVRRGITTFDDAMEAAFGLKRGEQQILNLCDTEPALRRKIVDFMSGVNFAQEGTWEEIGQDIYIVAPSTAFIEVAPSATRIGTTNSLYR